MRNQGYIKLSRKFFENALWKEPRQYSRSEAWIDLIQMARFEDSNLILNNRVIEVRRGEIAASRRFLESRWLWGSTKVSNFLDYLKKNGMINQRQTNGQTIITLCNYDIYNMEQTGDDDENKPPTNQRQTSGKPPTNQNKECKECKEGKECKEDNILPNPPFKEGIRNLTVNDDSWECNQQVREFLTETGFEWKAEIPAAERGDGHSGRVDLIAERGNEKYAIEIDRTNPREKSIFKLRQFDDSFTKIILLRGGIKNGMIGNDIHVISLKTNDNQRKEKVARKRKELDLSFVDPAFRPVMSDWLAYKSERGQTYRQGGVEACYRRLLELSGHDADKARRVVEQSKANNWAGLFEIKTLTDNENDRQRREGRRGSLEVTATCAEDYTTTF